MSVSARVPGRSGGGANLSALDQAAKDAQAAMMQGAEAEGVAGRERIAARADMMKRREELAAAEARAQSRLREEEDRVNNAYMQTLNELSQKREIDPNHFWNTRSDGQKALMVIGVFLAGIGRKDPSAQINQMIQRDIATQRENFEMARQGARDRAAGLNTIYGRLRQRGMDEKEAFAASRALMGEQMASQLEDIADRAVDPVAKSKAQLAAANMRMNVEKTKSDITLQAAQTAHLRNQDMMARIEFGAKMAGGPKQKEMQATLSKELQGLNDALASVRQMRADAGGGFLDRLKVAVSEKSPVGGIVAPGQVAKGRDFRGRAFQLMTELARGALQPAEMARLEKIIPQNINPMEDPDEFLQMTENFIAEQIARRQEAYRGAGPDTRGESAGGQGGAR
jgi:hypothetical protein